MMAKPRLRWNSYARPLNFFPPIRRCFWTWERLIAKQQTWASSASSAARQGTPLLHQVYGDIYKDERAWENAVAHYYRALEQDPHWQGAHFGIGEVALHREKLDIAEQEYRKELVANPGSAAALARLAEIAMLQGKPALPLFSQAIHIAGYQAANALGLPRAYPAGKRRPQPA